MSSVGLGRSCFFARRGFFPITGTNKCIPISHRVYMQLKEMPTLLHPLLVLLHTVALLLILLLRPLCVLLLVPFSTEICVGCLCTVRALFVGHSQAVPKSRWWRKTKSLASTCGVAGACWAPAERSRAELHTTWSKHSKPDYALLWSSRFLTPHSSFHSVACTASQFKHSHSSDIRHEYDTNKAQLIR